MFGVLIIASYFFFLPLDNRYSSILLTFLFEHSTNIQKLKENICRSCHALKIPFIWSPAVDLCVKSLRFVRKSVLQLYDVLIYLLNVMKTSFLLLINAKWTNKQDQWVANRFVTNTIEKAFFDFLCTNDVSFETFKEDLILKLGIFNALILIKNYNLNEGIPLKKQNNEQSRKPNKI